MNRSLSRVVVVGLVFVSVACGGIAIVDDADGGGGDGGGGSTNVGVPATDVATANVATTGGGCELLEAAYDDAIARARACSLTEPQVVCDGSAIVLDKCGCPSVVVNETRRAEVEAARAAYDAWIAGGCGPFDCEQCFPAKGGYCEGDGTSGEGLCVGFGVD